MARKSRAEAALAPGPKARVWRIAIYIRLSREDGRHPDESESVSNQRRLIEAYIAGLDDGDAHEIVGEYVDDGVSGTTDEERGGFQKMLEDIGRGRVNCVIVKDLARSFRNYGDQGYYLDDWFPRHGVRFISMFHQTLDSYKDPRNMRSLAVPIQGVMNEQHCAETSEKIRAVFDIKRRCGAHIGSFAPYGYLKHPGDKNALVVDEEAAAVVRDIYAMLLDGMSKTAIVRHLNDHGVLCPTRYKREVLNAKYANPHAGDVKSLLWSFATITSILKNRMYCGDMVQGRYRVISYKVHIQERLPQADWFVVENTHPAIIRRRDFDRVQQLLGRDTRTAPGGGALYLFSGLLRCADCGAAMVRHTAKGTTRYYCGTYKKRSKTACTQHAIAHNALEAAVGQAIRQQVYLAVCQSDALAAVSGALPQKARAGQLREAIVRKEKALARVMRYGQWAWQDWREGEISHTAYRHMREDYDHQAAALTAALDALQEEQAQLEADVAAQGPPWLDLRQCPAIGTLTRDMLIELVDHIQVYAGGCIGVRFRFADPLRGAEQK